MPFHGVERRQWPRMPIVLSVRLRAKDFGGFCHDLTTDVGMGGLFLRTRDPRPIGTPVEIELVLETEGVTLRCQGVVVRSVGPELSRLAGWPMGMGIRFTRFDEGGEHALSELLARYLS